MKNHRAKHIVLGLALSCLSGFVNVANGQEANKGDALLKGFQNPPNSAKPRVWGKDGLY